MDFIFLCNDNIIELLHMNSNCTCKHTTKEYNMKELHNPSHILYTSKTHA